MYICINENIRIIKDYTGSLIIKEGVEETYLFKVNSSGSEILSLCDGTKNINNIFDYIEGNYDIESKEEKESIHLSISSFLNEYIKKGVLNVIDRRSPVTIDEVGDENLIIPSRLSLELTNKCQLKCKHCFNLSGEERQDEIDIDQFINISRKFLELGTRSIFITGGEAFLKDGIERLIEFAANSFGDVTVASNGYYIKDEIIKLISSFNNIVIQISVDGKEEIHDNIRGRLGAFKNSISTIEKMISHNIPVTIAFTMNQKNMNDLNYVIETSKEMGCIGITISATSNTGRAKENNIGDSIDNFSEIIKIAGEKYRSNEFQVSTELCEDDIKEIEDSIEYVNKCGAGYKTIHIFSDGKISMCPCIKSINLGDVKEDIKKILYYKNIEKTMNIPTPNKLICGECINYISCGKCIANMLDKSKEECAVLREFNI